MGLQISLGQNDNEKIEIEKKIFGLGLQQQSRFLVMPLGLHHSPLGPS